MNSKFNFGHDRKLGKVEKLRVLVILAFKSAWLDSRAKRYKVFREGGYRILEPPVGSSVALETFLNIEEADKDLYKIIGIRKRKFRYLCIEKCVKYED